MRYVLTLLFLATSLCACDIGNVGSGSNTTNTDSQNTDNSTNTTNTTNHDNSETLNGNPGLAAQLCPLFFFPDGELKNLWKPEAEGGINVGALVILLNNDFADMVQSVCVRRAEKMEGDEVIPEEDECCVPSGNTNPDRPTFRCSRPGGDYTGAIKLTLLEGGGVCEATVLTPGERVD